MSNDDVSNNPGDEMSSRTGTVIPQLIEDEMKRSYLDYAMSVIVGRALPDARDGLKPVHRRILYAMYDMGMRHNSPFKKCARIVGEVLGKYHPHGDQSVYDALVRMAQDFSLRYPLVQGQGNFGSVDGDSPAAMRYTEARLSKIADEMLADIEKDTVTFIDNFDGSLKEPAVLPAKLPSLLLNGSNGIAVGMATNIPPHNLSEVADAIVAVIDNPEIPLNELMTLIPGPDFPTGGIIAGRNGILSAYKSGRGRIKVKAVVDREEFKGRVRFIIKELPYQVNKAVLVEQIAGCVKDKIIEGISDLRDESDRNGMRVVIELKKDANPDVVLNALWKHTRMQSTFSIMMLALVDNQPRVLSLKEIINIYISHRRVIVRKRTEFDLAKAEARAHILEGLRVALDNIDDIVALIKKAPSPSDARDTLIGRYSLSEKQAQAILDMKLQRLTGLEREKLMSELESLKSLIANLKRILSDESEILLIIRNELLELKERFGDSRRTLISDADEEIDLEDLISPEDVVVTISHQGYIKRMPVHIYRSQNRGGKGVKGASTKDDDFIEHLFIANTHDYLLIFTDKGRVYWKKVYSLPEGSRQSKGRPIINLIELDNGELVKAVIPLTDLDNNNDFLMFVTRKGLVKKTPISSYSRPRKGGIIAVSLSEGDDLITVLRTRGDDQILLASANGQAVRFSEGDVRVMGRCATGVRGIRLRDNDYVIGAVKVSDSMGVLTITENGYGKRTSVKDYRLINRGGKGVRNIICSSRNGLVVDVKAVTGSEELMLASRNGVVIRLPVSQIRSIGRSTQGVRVMSLRGDDKVVACAVILSD